MHQSAEVLTSGGGPGPREPRRWAIPAVVTGAAVLGVVSVPLLLSLTGGSTSPAAETAALSPVAAAPASPARAGASQAPLPVATSAPTRAPRASLALSTPVPPNRVHLPSAQPNRSASASGSASPSGTTGQSGGRSASATPLSGPAGRTVTISGHCLPGTDTAVLAGTTAATQQALPADGTFSVSEQLPGSGTETQLPLIVQCFDANGTVTFEQSFVYRVTGTAAPQPVPVPNTIPADAGPLNAPQTAPARGAVRVSGAGFAPGAPVAFQVRNADTGKVESSGRATADAQGQASTTVTMPSAAGNIQVIAAGAGSGGGAHVLYASVTTT